MKTNLTQACSSALQNLGETRDGISLPEKVYSGELVSDLQKLVDKYVHVCVVDGCEHLGQPCESCEADYCNLHSVSYNRQRLCADCCEEMKLADYRNGSAPEFDVHKDWI